VYFSTISLEFGKDWLFEVPPSSYLMNGTFKGKPENCYIGLSSEE